MYERVMCCCNELPKIILHTLHLRIPNPNQCHPGYSSWSPAGPSVRRLCIIICYKNLKKKKKKFTPRFGQRNAYRGGSALILFYVSVAIVIINVRVYVVRVEGERKTIIIILSSLGSHILDIRKQIMHYYVLLYSFRFYISITAYRDNTIIILLYPIFQTQR